MSFVPAAAAALGGAALRVFKKRAKAHAKAALEKAVASAVPRKKKKAQKGPKRVTAPLASGSYFRQIRHKPVIVSGTSLGCSLKWSVLGSYYYLANALGEAGSGAAHCLAFNVDPSAKNSLASNFQIFPTSLRAMATSFMRWRVRRLKVTFIPYYPATTAGAVAFGCLSDVTSNTTSGMQFSFEQLGAFECSTRTPIWQTASLNLLGPGGLRTDWCFQYDDSEVTMASERQVSAGIFAVTPIAGPSSSSGSDLALGSFQFDWEFEFDGISPSNYVGAAGDAPSSSASVSVQRLDQVAYDSSLSAPLGPAGSEYVSTGPSYGLPDPSSVQQLFIRQSGIYRITFQWSAITNQPDPDPTTELTMDPLYSSGVLVSILSSSASGAPPFSAVCTVAVLYGDDPYNGTTVYAGLSLGGLAALAAGQAHITIELQGSASDSALLAKHLPALSPPSSSSSSSPVLVADLSQSTLDLARVIKGLAVK